MLIRIDDVRAAFERRKDTGTQLLSNAQEAQRNPSPHLIVHVRSEALLSDRRRSIQIEKTSGFQHAQAVSVCLKISRNLELPAALTHL